MVLMSCVFVIVLILFFVIVIFFRFSCLRFDRVYIFWIIFLILWLRGLYFIWRVCRDVICDLIFWVKVLVFFLIMFVFFKLRCSRLGIFFNCLVNLMIFFLRWFFDRLRVFSCGICFSDVVSDVYFWLFILILESVR